MPYHENDLSTIILDKAFKIHQTLGPGLFESIYEEIMYRELVDEGLVVEKQLNVPVFWNNQKLDFGFRADLIVENKVIVEIKSIEKLAPVHHKQLLTYLRLTNIKLGLLINFNEAYLKDGVKRIANNL